jgi:hypothetical protein
MAIAPDDSDNRLRARISLSPSYSTAADIAADKAVADANALVNKVLGMTATSTPVFTPPVSTPVATPAVTETTKPLNKMTPEELAKYQADRLAAIKNDRLTGGGTTPPYEAPAGTHWSFIGGEWKLYKDFVALTGGGSNTGGGTNGGGDTGTGNGTSGTLPSVPTTPTLAIDTFKNTLAIFFGQSEMTKPWVDGLYKSISSFYKTGSTVDESFNLALQSSRNDPAMKPFTDRFKGIYALQDMKVKGSAIDVPTIAEYFATESKMGDILRGTGLSTLATESFLGDVIGKGVSATEFANRITTVFDRIDQAPKEIKDTLTRFFPTVDRTQLATALLGGDKTAKELEKKIQGYEVLAAAETQGIGANTLTGGITEDIAGNLAAGGGTYANTLSGFAQVAQARTTEQKLAEISGTTSMGVTGLTNAVLGKKAKELTALEQLGTQEENRFRGKAGIATLASSRRAQSF